MWEVDLLEPRVPNMIVGPAIITGNDEPVGAEALDFVFEPLNLKLLAFEYNSRPKYAPVSRYGLNESAPSPGLR